MESRAGLLQIKTEYETRYIEPNNGLIFFGSVSITCLILGLKLEEFSQGECVSLGTSQRGGNVKQCSDGELRPKRKVDIFYYRITPGISRPRE